MATKIVDATKLDNALSATADAIRSKTGSSASITFDLNNSTGFASAVSSIVIPSYDTWSGGTY